MQPTENQSSNVFWRKLKHWSERSKARDRKLRRKRLTVAYGSLEAFDCDDLNGKFLEMM